VNIPRPKLLAYSLREGKRSVQSESERREEEDEKDFTEESLNTRTEI